MSLLKTIRTILRPPAAPANTGSSGSPRLPGPSPVDAKILSGTDDGLTVEALAQPNVAPPVERAVSVAVTDGFEGDIGGLPQKGE